MVSNSEFQTELNAVSNSVGAYVDQTFKSQLPLFPGSEIGTPQPCRTRLIQQLSDIERCNSLYFRKKVKTLLEMFVVAIAARHNPSKQALDYQDRSPSTRASSPFN